MHNEKILYKVVRGIKCEDQNNDRKKRCLVGCMAASYAAISVGGFLSGCTPEVSGEPQMPNSQALNSETPIVSEEPAESVLMAKELTKGSKNKAVRVLDSLNVQLGENTYLEEVASMGSPEEIDDQGAYIADVLSDVTDKYGVEEATKVMRACGYQCISSSITDQAKKLYQESESMEQFVKDLNTKVLTGGDVWFEDGTIHATYENCYCSIDDKQKKLNKCYCQCSCGWYEKLFTAVTEHAVDVELVSSIKGGDEKCEFIITLDSEAEF